MRQAYCTLHNRHQTICKPHQLAMVPRKGCTAACLARGRACVTLGTRQQSTGSSSVPCAGRPLLLLGRLRLWSIARPPLHGIKKPIVPNLIELHFTW